MDVDEDDEEIRDQTLSIQQKKVLRYDDEDDDE